MNRKTDVEIEVNGNKLVLSGFESEEYLHKIMNYIADRTNEIKNIDGYSMLSADVKHLLLDVNLTDDYFKVKQRLDELLDVSDEQIDAVGTLKRELVSKEQQLHITGREIEQLRKLLLEEQKKSVKLETELNLLKKEKKA